MKKHLIAAAALATLSTATFAQSATVYGIVDMALQSLNKTTTAGNRNTTLDSGGLSPSIFGFRGTEDLGGGLKANFNLEGHFTADNGAGQQWGGLFGRQANVGLSSSAGSITLGKQYTAAVLAFAATDPRGLKETNSGLMSWATTANGTADHTASGTKNTNVPIGVFAANAVGVSTKVGNLSLSGNYAFGEQAGEGSRNAATSIGAVYADGSLTVSTGFQKLNGNATNTSKSEGKQTFAGVGYKLGAATVKVNLLDAKGNDSNGVEDSKVRVIGAGVDYAWNSKNTVTVAYYDAKDKLAGAVDSDSKTWILSNDYSLSKRTTVYGLVAGSKNGANYYGGSAFGNSLQTANGTTQTLFQAGVRHTF